MRICLFTKTTLAHGLGGVEVHVENLCRGVRQRGHDLTLLTSAHPQGLAEEARNGCPVHYLSGTRPARYDRRFWRESLKAFRALHRAAPFDAVWGEDFAAFGYARFPAGRNKPPLLSIMQGSTWPGLVRSEWNRVNSLREALPFAYKFMPEALFCYRSWYGHTLRGSDRVVAVSDATAQDYASQYALPPGKVRVIYNSVETTLFKPDEARRRAARGRLSLPAADPVVLMAAVVHKQKGMHVGLRAFQILQERFPASRLVVAGDGAHLPALRELARQWGLAEKIKFCGAVANHDMPDIYNAADIFLNPTLRWEGLPITTVEAMASGLPVVISRIGGTVSTIEEGTSGFFTPPGDGEAAAARCVEILQDPGLARRLGDAARRRAETHFSLDKMAEDYISLTEEMRRERAR